MRESVYQYVLESRDFQQLLDSLIKRGYRVLGPTVRDGAIVYDELTSTNDLPVGWTDEQNGGTYRRKSETIGPCLATPRAHIPGKNSFIRL